MDWMSMLLAAAAIITALSLAALVVFLAMTLTSLSRTLNNIAELLDGVEKQLEGITTETTLLLDKTNDLTADVNNKVAKLDNVFYGVDELGGVFYKLTLALNRFSSNLSKTTTEDVEKATQAVKWGSALLNLVKKDKQ